MSILIAGGHRRALAGFRFPPCTSAASTRAAQLSILDQLLDIWSETTQMAERLEERTTQYRFRYMAFGDVARSQHVTAVDDLGTSYIDTKINGWWVRFLGESQSAQGGEPEANFMFTEERLAT